MDICPKLGPAGVFPRSPTSTQGPMLGLGLKSHRGAGDAMPQSHTVTAERTRCHQDKREERVTGSVPSLVSWGPSNSVGPFISGI